LEHNAEYWHLVVATKGLPIKGLSPLAEKTLRYTCGAVLKLAYKDILLVPKSTLLQELDGLENDEYTRSELHD
jgi:hypothetical protein